MVELLAPAGSRESLVAAIESGANAVYLAGTMFGARAYAANFDNDGLREAIRFAHMRGVQVHVAVNTIIDDNELPELKKYLRFLSEAGADAVLVQDLGVARIVRETVPELPMHSSTQMTVHNLDGVKALEALGFSRVVLSREVSLETVRHICAHAKAEIEMFIHGALCVCYSGQCLMSSMIGGRSGNRGRCAQPCRLPYTLVDENDNDLLGNSAGKYLLSPRDMNTVELLPQLLDAGVNSFKIEGRMKRPEYVAIAVNAYRHAIDSHLQGNFKVTDEDKKALTQIFNRDFTTAFLEKKQGRNMMSDKRPNNRGLMLGRVQEYDAASGMVVMKLSTDLSEGDQVDFWVKVGGRVTVTVENLQLVKNQQTRNGKKSQQGKKQAKHNASLNSQNLVHIEKAEAGTLVAFATGGRVFPGDRAFKVYDVIMMDKAKSMYNSGAPIRRIDLDVKVTASVGEPMRIYMVDAEGNKAESSTDFIGQEAMKRPLTRETIAKQISRLGTSIFALNNLETEINGNVMVPVSEINEARRKCVEELEEKRVEIFEAKRQAAVPSAEIYGKAQNEINRKFTGITVVADDLDKVRAALEGGAKRIIFGGDSYNHKVITPAMYEKAAALAHGMGCEIIFNTPRIIRDGRELELVHEWLPSAANYSADGINVHNIGMIYAVRTMTDLPIETDYSLISYNVETLRHLREMGVVKAVLSPELTFSQVAKLAEESPMPLECLVDGNLELMVSEYCCTGSFLGGLDTGKCSAPCVNAGSRFYLKDRKDITFPLVMDQYCHMHVLNGNRLSMLPHAMKFKPMGISGLRIDGRYMTPEELRKIVMNYGHYMNRKGELSEDEKKIAEQLEGKNITRGHYFRGVL